MEVAAGPDHQQLVTIKVVEALGRSGSPRRDLVPRHRAWLVTDPPAALLEAQAVIHLPVVDEEAGIESTHLAEGAAGEEPAAADHVVAVDRLGGIGLAVAGAPARHEAGAVRGVVRSIEVDRTRADDADPVRFRHGHQPGEYIGSEVDVALATEVGGGHAGGVGAALVARSVAPLRARAPPEATAPHR